MYNFVHFWMCCDQNDLHLCWVCSEWTHKRDSGKGIRVQKKPSPAVHRERARWFGTLQPNQHFLQEASADSPLKSGGVATKQSSFFNINRRVESWPG